MSDAVRLWFVIMHQASNRGPFLLIGWRALLNCCIESEWRCSNYPFAIGLWYSARCGALQNIGQHAPPHHIAQCFMPRNTAMASN